MRLAGVFVPLFLLGACTPSVGSLSCEEITTKAKTLSQGHETKIKALANVRETSRTEHDVRCRAEASWSDNANTTIYVRAYGEGENRMVAYQSTPFE